MAGPRSLSSPALGAYLGAAVLGVGSVAVCYYLYRPETVFSSWECRAVLRAGRSPTPAPSCGALDLRCADADGDPLSAFNVFDVGGSKLGDSGVGLLYRLFITEQPLFLLPFKLPTSLFSYFFSIPSPAPSPFSAPPPPSSSSSSSSSSSPSSSSSSSSCLQSTAPSPAESTVTSPDTSLHMKGFVCSNSAITSLNLANNEIGPSGATVLSKFLGMSSGSLLHLSLAQNKIGNKGLSALSQNFFKSQYCCLTDLDLSDCGLDAEGMSAVATLLCSELAVLERLNLSGNRIGVEGAQALAQYIIGAPSLRLRTLLLDQNGIRDEGAASLAHALAAQSSVTALSLADNGVETSGAMACGHLLMHSTSLVSLSLAGNAIGDAGIAALAHALTCNSSLRCMHLAETAAGNGALQSLADALRTNTSLSFMSLSENEYISDPGIEALFVGMKENRSLKTLLLDATSVSRAGAWSAAQILLDSNDTLQVLSLQETTWWMDRESSLKHRNHSHEPSLRVFRFGPDPAICAGGPPLPRNPGRCGGPSNPSRS
eukprot:gnl/Spiro4/11520_TR6082_c0_g1_i1.p1 gnl/Spiro4/11520_TR6082_c0_g1~~gnl/Spiro4/11520_TR6082_c0_g1_i1.p1  ORF type:complete len:543 (-),score=110.41 gnl/Spiro4/11520_TR6082_c0_g1_i1:146-1774(-)